MRYWVLCVDVARTGRYVTWLPGAQLQCWMLLTVFTLPQLAVSAKILCLLMVVICGAVPSMVKALVLHSDCAHEFIHVLPNGTVVARRDLGGDPNITFSTVVPTSLDLLMYSPIQKMFICFSGSKLVGRKISRAKAVKMDKCLFREELLQSGYNRYRLANHAERYIGFNRKGMQLRRLKNRMRMNQQKCLDFVRKSHHFDINKHNIRVGGGLPLWAQGREPSQVPNPVRGPCHRARHRHGGLQRRNCDLT